MSISSATDQTSQQAGSTAGERPWNSYRFLLFIVPEYYPSGGMSDFFAGADTIEEAQAICKKLGGFRHVQIADMETNEYWGLRA